MAAPPQDDAVAEGEDGVGAEVEVRHHARRQGHVLGDDAVLADLDPRVAEDGPLREGEPGAGPDAAEAVRAGALGRDGGGLPHPVHAPVDGARNGPAPPGSEG